MSVNENFRRDQVSQLTQDLNNDIEQLSYPNQFSFPLSILGRDLIRLLLLYSDTNANVGADVESSGRGSDEANQSFQKAD